MKKYGIWLAAVWVAISAPALAQLSGKHDSSLPIEINADSLEVLQKEQLAIFKGNVVATQGTINLRSDKMTVHYRNQAGNANGITRIEVDGHVFMATPQETARGDNGAYDVDQKEITLQGDVVLTRDKNVLKGSRLDYNLVSGKSIVTGGANVTAPGGQQSGGRVRGLFVPQK